MGKKLISWGFAAAVLLLSVALAVGMVFAGPSPAGANEVLSDPPALRDKDGGWNADFLSDTAQWFSDHFFLRQELISWNNRLTAAVFGTSGAEDVILDTDGWLFYGQTLDDYTGLNPMTDRELYGAANNLALMAEYCREEGKQFVFLAAPNKNSLYPELMPECGVTAQTKNVDQLFSLLGQMEVPYLDLYTVFAEQEQTLYFAHDSHWNEQGAALAADAINEAFGRESGYFAGDFSQYASHDGDLYEMLYPAFRDPEQSPVYGGSLDFTYASSANKPDSITLVTESGGSGSLLAYRDSFGNLLYPYLADSFGQARFSRSVSYDLTLEADFVLIELVERNLGYLVANLPVMPAPERELALPESSGTAQVTVGKADAGLVQVKGTLPLTPDVDSPVYVVCGGRVYEAFCLKNDGFGLNIPEDMAPEAVAFFRDGALRLYTIQS